MDGDAANDGEDLALAAGWSKEKRTRRAKVMVVGNGSITTAEEQLPAPSSEEEDLANFLVMLSSSASSAARPHVIVEVDQEPCATKNEKRNHQLLVPQPIPW